MKVMKFGGSSLANFERFQQVANLVQQAFSQPLIVVLSAPQGMTNELVALAHAAKVEQQAMLWQSFNERVAELLAPWPKTSELDGFVETWLAQLQQWLSGIALLGVLPAELEAKIISQGEDLSVRLLQALLTVPCQLLDSERVVKASGPHLNAEADLELTREAMQQQLAHVQQVTIMQGFIGQNEAGERVTLGRNGSDYSGAIMAYAANAAALEIWTDVDGVYSADPRKVEGAKKVDSLSYQEALALSYFGASVLHPKTISPVAKGNIPCWIKSTLHPQNLGSVICQDADCSVPVKAISSLSDLAMVTVQGPGLKGRVGMASKVFAVLAQHQISIVLITQSSSEFSISFCIQATEQYKAVRALQQSFALEIQSGWLSPIAVKQDVAIVSLVGDGMRQKRGIAATFFSSLAQAGVNVIAIAQDCTEGATSAVIAKQDCTGAVRVCHENFFTHVPSIDVFLVGCGNVGSALIKQIERQQSWLQSDKHVKLNVVALANSKGAAFCAKGFVLNEWQQHLLQPLAEFSPNAAAQFVCEHHLVNPVLVDCTSDQTLADSYVDWLKAGFHVVTANKKANTSSFEYYLALRQQARLARRKFLYETNVGAGLPVINNLQALCAAGDELTQFSGILSGSLSYILGRLEDGLSLSAATEEARQKGFTEPHPVDDLSGMDVARKLLIVAREAGLQFDLTDIEVEPLYPATIDSQLPADQFMAALQQADQQMTTRVEQAKAQGAVLRYVATIHDGRCRVGIEQVPLSHPLAAVKEGENALAVYTRYYSPRPFVIRGYGAGADVTAAGVFADILQTLSLEQGGRVW